MKEINVKLQLDSVGRILLKRLINKNGEAQKFMSHEVKRLCDPYVPCLSGTLKNSAVPETRRVLYTQKYAKKQYYGNKGSGMRGKLWDRRMIADKGHQLVMSVANFVGGRTS